MYDELKERCRACSQGCIYPSECSYFEKPPLRCMRQLLSEAADAIDNLSEQLDSMNEANIALYGALPKWIPVSERLPEMRAREDDDLRCSSSVLFRTDRTIHIGYVIEDSYNDEYAGEVKLHRWYMQGCYRIENVTHWMPLPGPPEEGK